MHPEALIGRILAQNFRIESLLGAGGMGAVYRGRQLSVDRDVAIKILKPDYADDPATIARFKLEAMLLGKLNHRNIVQVIEFGERDLNPTNRDIGAYLVMEFLDGEDLDGYLRRTGRLSYSVACKLASEVGSALHAAHQRGIVHRDVKPHNIFIHQQPASSTDGETFIYKVVDFGVSKFASSTTKTPANLVIGTPQYMSPEGAQGLNPELDGRADQFSLAVVLYRALSGCSPFSHSDIAVVVHRVLSHCPVPLINLVSDLPLHASEAIERALQKRKEDRFSSIVEFVEAFAGRSLALQAMSAIQLSAVLAPETQRLQPLRVDDVNLKLPAIVDQQQLELGPPRLDGAAPQSAVGWMPSASLSHSMDPDLLGGLTPSGLSVAAIPSYTTVPPAGRREMEAAAVALYRPAEASLQQGSRVSHWPSNLATPTGYALGHSSSVHELSRLTPGSRSLSESTGQTQPQNRSVRSLRPAGIALSMVLVIGGSALTWRLTHVRLGSSVHSAARIEHIVTSTPTPQVTPLSPLASPDLPPADRPALNSPATGSAPSAAPTARPLAQPKLLLPKARELSGKRKCSVPAQKCIFIPGAPQSAAALHDVLRTEKVWLCPSEILKFVRNPYTSDKRFSYDPPIPSRIDIDQLKAVASWLNQKSEIPSRVDSVVIGCPAAGNKQP